MPAASAVMSRRGRRIGLWSLAFFVALVLSMAAGALVVRQRSLRSELEQAREALAAGRLGVAHSRLVALAKRWTNDGEVYLLLGECELARNQREEALAAWSRVAPSSPFFGRAAVMRATHLINSGRYTPAEELLIQALRNPDEA